MRGADNADPDLDYYYGSALAQLGRWDDAYRVFLRGYRLDARDKRFAVELGGVAFKQKRYQEAASWASPGASRRSEGRLRQRLSRNGYFLQGNLDGALKYWKPRQQTADRFGQA